MTSEFELIAKYFTRPAKSAIRGIGDDCALLRISDGNVLAVSTDMLVEGTHFLAGTAPRGLGHKTLAVNLSDIAAMGARARWVLLSISLPEVNEAWLREFSDGFLDLASRSGVELVGGDTTRGPLTLCATVFGEVAVGQALSRSGAVAGDDIWVSGDLGGASMALAYLSGKAKLEGANSAICQRRLEFPVPRLGLGEALAGVAHAAIDVSDGLLADLGHLLKASSVGADIYLHEIPHCEGLLSCGDARLIEQCVLGGGDDYELVFAASSKVRSTIREISVRVGVPLTRIGSITAAPSQLRVLDKEGIFVQVPKRGYDHFQT